MEAVDFINFFIYAFVFSNTIVLSILFFSIKSKNKKANTYSCRITHWERIRHISYRSWVFLQINFLSVFKKLAGTTPKQYQKSTSISKQKSSW